MDSSWMVQYWGMTVMHSPQQQCFPKQSVMDWMQQQIIWEQLELIVPKEMAVKHR